MNTERGPWHVLAEAILRSLRSVSNLCVAGALLFAISLGWITGCGGSSGSPPPSNPTPSLASGSLNPSSATAGGAAFTLTITGSNFISSSTVQWNGSARTTTFVSSTSLQAAITAADIATPGTAMVTVSTPAPGGGTSAGISFTIKAAIPVVTISPSSAIVAAGGQQQFQATVTKTQNAAVTWQVNNITGGSPAVGAISSSGLYIAPSAAANVTVSAVSQADSNQSASANLVVRAPHPIGVRPPQPLLNSSTK